MNPSPRLAGTCLEPLAERRLVVVTGKGGVGKSTVAASLARLLAGGERRVLLLEVDPRENAHQLLGVQPSGGELAAAGRNLWLQNLKPREVVDEIVREQVKIGLVVRRLLASPVYEHFAAGMPGLKEVAVLSHALRQTAGKEPRFDLVVLDAPATGHGISLLSAPRLLSEVLSSGPVGRLAAELASFAADPRALGVVAVTLAEEMPVEEVLELDAGLVAAFGRRAELLVVNGLYPPFPSRQAGATTPARELWKHRRSVNERELARLKSAWVGPLQELPLWPLDRGPALVEALGGYLLGARGAA